MQMPWVRLDEEFARHPKVAAAGPLAIAMQVAGLCYCNQNLTDGFIPRSVARTLLDWQVERPDGTIQELAVTTGMCGDDVTSDWVIELMLEAGLWDRVPRGYQIHDYLDYQPSKVQVIADREQKREAGRRGGLASRKAKQASAQAGAQASAEAPAQAEHKHPLKRNASEPPSETQAEGVAESNPVPVPGTEVSQEQDLLDQSTSTRDAAREDRNGHLGDLDLPLELRSIE